MFKGTKNSQSIYVIELQLIMFVVWSENYCVFLILTSKFPYFAIPLKSGFDTEALPDKIGCRTVL
jgi:hypothetical protein